MWAGLVLIILLIFMSIYGAFLGSDRAKSFFNCFPLTTYWLALVLLLIAAIAAFRRLVHIPELFLIHLGCILILTGSMWGSDAGHKLQKQLFGIDKIRTGQMKIFEGHRENIVTLANGGQTRKLPFSIRLKDFRIEYYEPQYHRTVSDYISQLQVIRDGRVVAAKNIEVNHPLHFGGYHFYQSSYDAHAGQYTILTVVSDTGLALVYAGYLMLGIGVFWRFWLRGIITAIKSKSG